MYKILLMALLALSCTKKEACTKDDDIVAQEAIKCNLQLSALLALVIEYHSLGGHFSIGDGTFCPSEQQLQRLREDIKRVKEKIETGEKKPEQEPPSEGFSIHQSPD